MRDEGKIGTTGIIGIIGIIGNYLTRVKNVVDFR